jgi:hypothetical protein
MLRYTCADSSEGVSVVFPREASWVSPIAAAVLVIAIRLFFVSVGRLTDNSRGFFVGAGIYLGGVGAVLVVMAACFVLAADLRRYRCLFSPGGITLTVCYFGIPLRKLALESAEIHKFGWSHRRHAPGTLQFAASGHRYYLAFNVAEHEAARFIEFLAEHGITYSAEEEPVHRKTAANTFLG